MLVKSRNDGGDRGSALLLILLTALGLAASLSPPASAQQPDAAGAATTPGQLQWVSWADPKEHAFQLEVPRGWSVEGGLARNGDSNYRQSVQVSASTDAMVVQIGDAGLPPFVVPSPTLDKAGLKEGSVLGATGGAQALVFHYMPALEFNRWYAGKRFEPIFDNFSIGKEHEEPELARQFTAIMQKAVNGTMPVEITVGETAISGRIKGGDQQISGAVISIVLHSGSAAKGDEAWIARPMLCGCALNDHTAASKAILGAVLAHMLQTWQDDSAWSRQYNEKQVASSPDVKKLNATPAQRASVIGTYWQTPAARDESARRFVKFIADSTGASTVKSGDATP